ncbi:MAG: metallopeptidase TldD-related protein [Elusimicrobia bacterium]|nr:metallopeptidase TldD-related protein [Elusimicrobiota bacterium]
MKNIETTLKKIFKLAKGVQCEVLAERRDSALTRFADNVISQNVASSSLSFSVRLQDGGRSAKLSLNQADDGSLKRAVASGLEILKKQKKDPDLLPLAGPKPLPAGRDLYDRGTAELSPVFRAERAAELARACRKAGQVACGTVDNGTSELVIANNLGLFARWRDSFITHSVTVTDRDGSGWAEQPSHSVSNIDFKRLNETARAKAAASRRPRDPKPGRYTVVLEPQAAADLITYMSAYSFGGQFYNEGRSFVCGKLGKRVLSPLLTIEDDFLGAAPGLPFDFEGQPRSRLTLVENGVLKTIVHDRKTAKKAKAAPTGHALPQPSYFGPLAINLSVKPGSDSLSDLIKGTERGILVTQFHYTNMLKAQTVEMTGMTRNGTFMIENGKVAYPIKNMRFTQSMVEAFANIEAVGDRAEMVAGWGGIACPAMRLSGFNFSSATKF